MLAEGEGADDDAHHRVHDRHRRQRPRQGPGLEGALDDHHPSQSQHDQGVGLPRRQGVEHPAVQEVADHLGQRRAHAVDDAPARPQ